MLSSSLKHKTIRLIFTILLSVIAFTMFGLVDTMASFNERDSVYQTVTQMNIKDLPIKKGSLYNSYPISEKDVQDMNNFSIGTCATKEVLKNE